MTDSKVEIISNENIIVGVRFRPLNANEKAANDVSAWKLDVENNTIAQELNVLSTTKNKQMVAFPFNHIFDEQSGTEDVYQGVVKDIVSSAMGGINGTIFAYGQTSSGKTFTMKGTEKDGGIISMAINQVFKTIKETSDREFLLRVSYLEIYNEQERDLLNPQGESDLAIHETKERGVFVKNLTESIVTSVPQVLQIIEQGETQRHYGRTNMNDFSSRSHTIFRLTIESKKIKTDAVTKVRVSSLNFVDLAGSERIRQTGTEGVRQKEGISINKSLLNLGIVISALSDNSDKHEKKHVPFRDSKLTRILSSSLGGNARTAIVCCASPALSNLEHTINCLRFGSRAVQIKQHAQINEVAEDKAMIFQHESKIKELRARLSHLEDGEEEEDNGSTGERKVKDQEKKARELAEQQLMKREMQLKIQHFTNLILVSNSSQTPTSQTHNGKQKKRRASFSHVPSASFSSREQHIANLFSVSGAVADGAAEPSSTDVGRERRYRSDFMPDKLTSEQDLFFRGEQYKHKIEQMDQLLKELSTENGELLKQFAEQVQQLEEVTARSSEQSKEIATLRQEKQQTEQKLAALTASYDMATSGQGLETQTEEQLMQMQSSMQANMHRVMKHLFYHEFRRQALTQAEDGKIAPVMADDARTKQLESAQAENSKLRAQLAEEQQRAEKEKQQKDQLEAQVKMHAALFEEMKELRAMYAQMKIEKQQAPAHAVETKVEEVVQTAEPVVAPAPASAPVPAAVAAPAPAEMALQLSAPPTVAHVSPLRFSSALFDSASSAPATSRPSFLESALGMSSSSSFSGSSTNTPASTAAPIKATPAKPAAAPAAAPVATPAAKAGAAKTKAQAAPAKSTAAAAKKNDFAVPKPVNKRNENVNTANSTASAASKPSVIPSSPRTSSVTSSILSNMQQQAAGTAAASSSASAASSSSVDRMLDNVKGTALHNLFAQALGGAKK